jgi:hypothetical protein
MVGTGRLGRPEHTGENRCWPCTILNAGVLGVVSVLVGLAQPGVGVAVALLGALVIWTRGYLIPYTPQFAPRLVQWLPIDPFHTRRGGDSLRTLGPGDTDDLEGERVLQSLVETGVVAVDGDRLTLSERFGTEWEERMDERAGASPEELADAALEASTVAASARAVEGSGRSFVVLSDGAGNVSWLDRPVAIAETAAAEALESADVPADVRDVAAHAVCAFLERCPACGDEVVETDASSCCGGTVPSPTETPPRVLACTNCDVRFFTLDAP